MFIILFALFLFSIRHKKVLNTVRNDDWKKIKKNMDKALKEYKKSEKYAKSNEYEKVIYHLTSAINLFPSGKYYGSRGIYKNCINDNNGAIEDLNKAIKAIPYEPLYWYVRAKIYYNKLNNKKFAFRDWKKAEQLGSVGAANALKKYFYDSEGNLLLDSQEKNNMNNVIQLKNNWIESKRKEIQDSPNLLDLLEETQINNVSYSKLLECFEWQYKRFKILVRDKFRCSDCGEYSEYNHVHHTYYLKNFLPWEIDDSALVSICKRCHSKRHEKENIHIYKNVNGRLIITKNQNSVCPRCYGSGYLPQFKHVENGICFLCFGDVINKTVFSERLSELSRYKETYNIKLLQDAFIDFTNSISISYYFDNILEKFHAEASDDDLPF